QVDYFVAFPELHCIFAGSHFCNSFRQARSRKYAFQCSILLAKVWALSFYYHLTGVVLGETLATEVALFDAVSRRHFEVLLTDILHRLFSLRDGNRFHSKTGRSLFFLVFEHLLVIMFFFATG